MSTTIDIKSPSGQTLLSTPINRGAKGYYSLMQHDYITLPFSLQTPIDFGLGSYVDMRGVFDEALGGKLAKIYYVKSLPTPAYNDATGGYDHTLRLDAYYWLWANFIFKYTPENAGQEAVWSRTSSPARYSCPRGDPQGVHRQPSTETRPAFHGKSSNFPRKIFPPSTERKYAQNSVPLHKLKQNGKTYDSHLLHRPCLPLFPPQHRAQRRRAAAPLDPPQPRPPSPPAGVALPAPATGTHAPAARGGGGVSGRSGGVRGYLSKSISRGIVSNVSNSQFSSMRLFHIS